MRSTLTPFALLLILSACSNGSDKSPAAPSCPEGDAAIVATDTNVAPDSAADDTAPKSPAPEALTWSVEFPTDGKLTEIPAIKFRGASGLASATSSLSDELLTTVPFEGYGGDTKDATALAGWFGKIVAWTPCDGCDATREWILASADLTRPAVVSAQTSDGQWLARWSMPDAWPVDYFGAKRKDGGVEVASLGLSGTVKTFEINPANPWLARALKSAGLAPSKLPDATIGYGKAPDFATAALARPRLDIDELVDGLSRFAASTPLYADSGSSGDNPLFEATDRRVLPPTMELRDGDVVLLRAVGIKQEIETMEFRVGEAAYARKRPGKTKFKNITLRRAEVVDPRALTWLDESIAGTLARKSGSIILHDREGNEVVRLAAGNGLLMPIKAGPSGTTNRWQNQGIGHTIVVKLVAETIETK